MATSRPQTLDMGKSCPRFRIPDDLPLDVIGEVFVSTPGKSIAHAEAARRK